MAQIYTSQKRYLDAIPAYREAVKHYIDLADANPTEFAPYVARIFKNIASFYIQYEKRKIAQYFYLKSIELYTELNHYNEYAYGLKLASSIIEGVAYYDQHTLSLYQAEAIIKKHDETNHKDELLEQIHYLREEKSAIL